ncbi:MAG: 1-acyl-sn-glycerol-3-phosphate acyltransferase [Acidimicrobiia bacterium]|nr:1-acyl-sn-glycerol-3-phosphate acyltransferase [Acidimicrobiia bacterium]
MSQRWTRPGVGGAVLYATLAAVVGTVATLTTRLTLARRRGQRAAANGLPDGPIIVISNHTSYADGVLLALACRRLGRSLRLLATSGVFRAPVIGRVARRLGFIPVNRGGPSAVHALDTALEALAAGEAIGLYPEGRITRDPAMWPERAKTGAVRLALRSGAPIVPVAIVGAHEVVGRRRILWRMLSNVVRRPRVRVEVGDPIDVRRLVTTDDPPPGEIRAAADAVMARLVTLVATLREESPEHPSGVPAAALRAGD